MNIENLDKFEYLKQSQDITEKLKSQDDYTKYPIDKSHCSCCPYLGYGTTTLMYGVPNYTRYTCQLGQCKYLPQPEIKMRNATTEEQNCVYQHMINNSIKTGINIFDDFTKEN